MKTMIALIAFLVGLWSQSQAVACTLKLSEFQAHLYTIEQETKQLEQAVLNSDREVKMPSRDLQTKSYGTGSTTAMTSLNRQFRRTQQTVTGLSDRLEGLVQESDDLFTCVLALRQHGDAALKKATKANDTTRLLRVQQSLIELAELDLKSIDLSIRIAIMVSEAKRLQQQIARERHILSVDKAMEVGLELLQ